MTVNPVATWKLTTVVEVFLSILKVLDPRVIVLVLLDEEVNVPQVTIFPLVLRVPLSNVRPLSPIFKSSCSVYPPPDPLNVIAPFKAIEFIVIVFPEDVARKEIVPV